VRCEHEVSVGAYVLDALEPDEQLRMAQHVQECPVCGKTVRELEGLPRLLAGVPAPGESPVAPVPSELAFERFRRSAAGTAPGRRRRVRWWVAAAAAVVLLAGGVTTAIVATSARAPTVVTASENGVRAAASFAPANHGTLVTLQVEGMPIGQWCELIAMDTGGHWEQAGRAWEVTHSGPSRWKAWVSFPPDEVDRFVVRTPEGQTLVTLPG